MNDMTRGATTGGTALAEPVATTDCTATKTLLLLDSVEVFLRFEETILQRRDWRVLRATTGAAALDILSRERVDLLVMDHHLPDLHGEHVIRAIRSNAALRALAILMVTARGDQAVVERCMAEGCNAFLYKPVSRQGLCSKVEQLLSVPARRHVRTLVSLQVESEGHRRAFFGNTVNLSVGGMLVESSMDMAIGDSMGLRFHLPGDQRPVIVLARVVRLTADVSTGQSMWGLSFEHLDEDDRRRIEAFVRATHAADFDADRAEGT